MIASRIRATASRAVSPEQRPNRRTSLPVARAVAETTVIATAANENASIAVPSQNGKGNRYLNLRRPDLGLTSNQRRISCRGAARWTHAVVRTYDGCESFHQFQTTTHPQRVLSRTTTFIC